MQLIPYLTFNGECEAAFKFYEACLGAKIVTMLNHEGTPAEGHVPKEWLKKIMHARLSLNGQFLMGSDGPSDRYEKPQGFSVTLQITDPAEAERVFKSLSEDGQIRMPLQETFWAARFGMLVDRFGIPWMINCEKPVQ